LGLGARADSAASQWRLAAARGHGLALLHLMRFRDAAGSLLAASWLATSALARMGVEEALPLPRPSLPHRAGAGGAAGAEGGEGGGSSLASYLAAPTAAAGADEGASGGGGGGGGGAAFARFLLDDASHCQLLVSAGAALLLAGEIEGTCGGCGCGRD
jgi:hypothetical protein